MLLFTETGSRFRHSGVSGPGFIALATLTHAEPWALFQVATIRTSPALRPSTSPSGPTRATAGSLLDQLTTAGLVIDPLPSETVAWSLTKAPPSIVALVGATVSTTISVSPDDPPGPVGEVHAANRMTAETAVWSTMTARMVTSGRVVVLGAACPHRITGPQ
jgi:hypothetical protein